MLGQRRDGESRRKAWEDIQVNTRVGKGVFFRHLTQSSSRSIIFLDFSRSTRAPAVNQLPSPFRVDSSLSLSRSGQTTSPGIWRKDRS